MFVFVPFVLFASSKSRTAPPFFLKTIPPATKGKKRAITRAFVTKVWPSEILSGSNRAFQKRLTNDSRRVSPTNSLMKSPF